MLLTLNRDIFVRVMLLLLIAVVLLLVMPYASVHAIAGIDDLVFIAALGTLLVSAGILAVSSDEMNKIAKDYYYSQPTITRQSIIDNFNTRVNGIMHVTSNIWDGLKAYVANFHIGSNTKNVSYTWYEGMPCVYNYSGITEDKALLYGAQTLTIQGITYSVVPDQYYTKLYCKRNGNSTSLYVNYRSTLPYGLFPLYDYYSNHMSVVFYYYDSTSPYAFHWTSLSVTVGDLLVVVPSNLNTNTGTATYKGDAVLGDPAWTVSGKDVQTVPVIEDLVTATPLTVVKSTTAPTTASVDLTVPTEITWDFSPIMNISLSSKFPFSIPWDIQALINPMTKTAKAPTWTIDLPNPPFIGAVPFTIDFSPFEVWAKIVRFFIYAIFIFGLIQFTSKWIGSV